MSQSVGLMAEVDLGTEHLRWMGDARFVLGFIRGVLAWKPCPVQLSIKVVEQDKAKMVENLEANRTRVNNQQLPSSPEQNFGTSLPPLKYTNDNEGWITFDKPLCYIYAGQGPYVARDLMQFPVSLPDDGLIDVVAQEQSTRRELLGAITGAEKGQPYWLDSQHYFKALAYRVKPISPKGYVSVDGEAFPFEEFQVEVHKELATFLSPYGRYAAEFTARP
jgi:sphingosine kinase